MALSWGRCANGHIWAPAPKPPPARPDWPCSHFTCSPGPRPRPRAVVGTMRGAQRAVCSRAGAAGRGCPWHMHGQRCASRPPDTSSRTHGRFISPRQAAVQAEAPGCPSAHFLLLITPRPAARTALHEAALQHSLQLPARPPPSAPVHRRQQQAQRPHRRQRQASATQAAPRVAGTALLRHLHGQACARRGHHSRCCVAAACRACMRASAAAAASSRRRCTSSALPARPPAPPPRPACSATASAQARQ